MNQIEEDITTDQELTEGMKPEEPKKKSELMRPEYQFKGIRLFPYTPGYQLLFNQIRDREDTGLSQWVHFMFLLSQINGQSEIEHQNWAMEIAWDIKKFKRAVFDWRERTGFLSDEDMIEARRIYDEIMKAIEDSFVEPVPSRAAGINQKKMRQKRNT